MKMNYRTSFEKDPMNRRIALVAGVLLLSSPLVSASSFVDTLGDSDFFGFGGGIVGVNTIPAIDVDNRTASDPLFTDHDIRPSVHGADNLNDVSWTHDFSAHLPLTGIISVSIDLALAGIQDALNGASGLDDRLFFEGLEIPGAFDAIDLGAGGTGLFSFALSPAQIASFSTDGVLDIFMDGGRRASNAALESYFIDYSTVTVVVPEPASLTLLLAMIPLACRRRVRL